MNWLVSLIQKNPRKAPVILLTFLLSASTLIAGGIYVLLQVIESERGYAKMEITLAKMRYENAEASLKARAKANTEQITRSVDALLPLLKEHSESVRVLKDEFLKRSIAEDTALPVYLKLAELDYRVTDLTRRLEQERLIAQNVAMPSPFAEPAEVFIRHLLPRIAVFFAAIAVASVILVTLYLRKKNA